MFLKLRAALFSAALLAFVPAISHADTALLQRPEVQSYLDNLAATQGFNRDDLTALFQQVNTKPSIITVLDRPSTGRPWYQFKQNFINNQRILGGARFMRRYADTLDAVSDKYGVPAEVITSILGVETLYGRTTGTFRVIDALTTIAFDYPRRADYFKDQLTQFMLLAREENENPLTFMGSYAGAMGMPQFMPSSFREYAVDWTGDHHRDIWGTPEDAIASVANFLAAHGWQRDGDTYAPVNVSAAEDDLLADKFNLHYTVAELMQKGVQPLSETDTSQQAVLFSLETEAGNTSYYMGFNNFYVVTRYNRSTLYATAVLQLANAIKSAYDNNLDLQDTSASDSNKSKTKAKSTKKNAAGWN
ncbi:lytic murein transglycosylase B [Silvimonas sp.]|uniref:lytic murein transglycosylase B n=1 Tax=Silvimonas sp. TaxID=2650811 RepID=UPI002846A42A|nr:lytic murein transglycosylase B [Silvimonas sp.]MDR3428602.1 lytic murein transglycosylase B [Silvimonas sp.]